MVEDKREQELNAATDCEWVRALDSNGNSIRISKSDLINLVYNGLPIVTPTAKGLMDKTFFMNREYTEDATFTSLESGAYPIYNGFPKLPGLNMNYGILIVLEVPGYYKAFIAIEYNLNKIQIKTYDSDWRLISFT